MALRKLTLSAPEEIIAEAKRIAASKNTSVSALFARLVRSVGEGSESEIVLGPITQRATGIASLPGDRSDRELLSDALDERYGSPG